MRKRKEVKIRHSIVIMIAKLIVGPILRFKYKYKYKMYRELKKGKPYLVLGNHTVSVDPILMGLSFPFHLYYFATEQIFNLGFLSKLLIWAVNPIKKMKNINDNSAIKKAKYIINQGGSIGLYPEGNVTYDGKLTTISISTVKLIRFLKVPVVFFATEGLYLSNPRWSATRKKGKSRGYISSILEVEEYQNMTDEAVMDYLYKELSKDAYEQNHKQISFQGKDLALGLERMLFVDLKTNKAFVNYTEKDTLKSKDSDFKLTYLNDGYILDNEGNKKTLYELNELTKKAYYTYYMNEENNRLFTEEVSLAETKRYKKQKLGKATLSLHKDKLMLQVKKNTLTYPFDDVLSIAIQGKNKLIVYTSEKTYLIILEGLSSPYKYLLTYQTYKERNKPYEHIEFSKFGL